MARELNDPDSLVRLAAVEALAHAEPRVRHRYLPRMLADPVRVVRIEAARALAGEPETLFSDNERASFAKALAEYVAAQTYNADRPEGRMSLGNLYAQRGDPGGAIAEYRQALALDPTFVPAYANLADLYRSRGADGEAVAVLREGLARNPRAATLHHALGLALVRQQQNAKSGRVARRRRTGAGERPLRLRLRDGARRRGRHPAALKVLDAAHARIRTTATCCRRSRSSP